MQKKKTKNKKKKKGFIQAVTATEQDMKSMLTSLLKNLNNIESCTSLDTSILNHHHKIDTIYLISKMERNFVFALDPF